MALWLYAVALPLHASLTEMNIPLDRVRAARQRLSFIWCSILAAVSLLVVLHLFTAVFQRFLFAGRLRHLFHAPPPPPLDLQSPAADEPAGRADTDWDSAPTEAVATADRAAVGVERRKHRHQVPCSRHSVLQSPPTTVDPLSPSYVSNDERSRRFRYPTAATLTMTQRRSSNISQKSSSINVEGIFYTDRIVESNV